MSKKPLLINDVTDKVGQMVIIDPDKGNVEGNRGMLTQILETETIGDKYQVQHVEVMYAGKSSGDPRDKTWALPGWFILATEFEGKTEISSDEEE